MAARRWRPHRGYCGPQRRPCTGCRAGPRCRAGTGDQAGTDGQPDTGWRPDTGHRPGPVPSGRERRHSMCHL